MPVYCHSCGINLHGQPYRPAYVPLKPSAGPFLCLPCDAAAWARIDAHAKTLPPSTPGNNVWE